MTKTVKPILFLLASLLAVSCFRENFERDGALLSIDKDQLSVAADLPGFAEIVDTLTINANRSWSAFFEPEVDWIKISSTEFENIARCEEKTKVFLHFDNNEARQDRSTTLYVTTAEGKKIIPVKQIELRPYLNLRTPSEIGNITCQADTSIIEFDSNIPWSAEIDESGTADVTIDKSEGKFSDKIVVAFAENEDPALMPEAVVRLRDKVTGTEMAAVHFVQGKAAPYIQWASKDLDHLGSAAFEQELAFKTNCNWTAELIDAEEGISLKNSSGTKDQKTVTIVFGEYLGVGNSRSASVKLSIAEGATAMLSVKQTANALKLDFSGGNQPFKTEIPHAANNTDLKKVWIANKATEYTLVCGGKEFQYVFYSGEGFGLLDQPASKTCGIVWQLTTKLYQGAWIKLPAVEGYTLKEVEVNASNLGSGASKSFIVSNQQPIDTTAPAKADRQGSVSLTKGTTGKVILSNPVQNTSYYMVAGNTSTYFSILNLYYE